MKNKKGKLGLIIAILILIILIALGGYWIFKSSNPKNVFISQINKTIDNYKGISTKTQDKKINTTLKLSGNIETENEETKQLAQVFNDSNLTVNLQADTNDKKAMMGLNIDYQNQSLLKGNVYYEQGDNNIYVSINDLFDKYFKVDINKVLSEESERKQIQEFLSGEILFDENENTRKKMKIIHNIVEKEVEDKYFEKSEEDGMTKNTMKINVKELKDIITNIAKKLESNQEFLSCFKDQSEVVKKLEDLAKQMKDYTQYDECNIEISIYTTGLLTKETKKVEFVVILSEKERATFILNKIDNKNYEFSLNIKMEQDNIPVSAEALKGTIKFEEINANTEKATIIVENVPDLGKVTLNVEKTDEETISLEEVNIADSVDIMNLTEQDQEKMLENFMKMRIYTLITPLFMGGIY